jgi:hypothetical protein
MGAQTSPRSEDDPFASPDSSTPGPSGRRRTSGPSLRGSGSRRETDPEPATESATTSVNINMQHELKIAFEKVPEDWWRFGGWNFKSKTRLLGMTGADPLTMDKFIDQIETLDSETLGSIPYDTPDEKRIDIKIFAAVSDAMNASEQEEHLMFMESSVKRGRGRMAYKALMETHYQKIMQLALKGQRAVLRNKCKGIKDLNAYLVNLKHNIFILKRAERRIDVDMVIECMLEAIEDIPELSKIHDDMEVMSLEERSYTDFLKKLENKAYQTKSKVEEKKEDSSKDRKGAVQAFGSASNPDADKICDNCKRKGHVKRNCFKLHPELKTKGQGGYQNQNNTKGKGKDNSKGKGKDKGKQGGAWGQAYNGQYGSHYQYQGKGAYAGASRAPWQQQQTWPQQSWGQGGGQQRWQTQSAYPRSTGHARVAILRLLEAPAPPSPQSSHARYPISGWACIHQVQFPRTQAGQKDHQGQARRE